MAAASPWWAPHVHADRRPILLARNRIEAAIRGYLAERDFVMVDPPGLQRSPGNETHLHAFATDLIGSGVNGVTGDYSRGASGFWIENGKITYPVSEVTIAGHLLDIFKSLAAANDLEFRYGVNAPTVRIEGLTLGGR